MCDYSLHSIRNRLAVEGERLMVHRFPTNSLGLAPITDVQCRANRQPDYTGLRNLWTTVRGRLRSTLKEPPCAVCIPPGARLMLRDIPERLQQQLGAGPEEEVTFTQLSASANTYRDAVRFTNRREILLQRLEEGQRVDVLSLSSEERPVEELRPAAVAW